MSSFTLSRVSLRKLAVPLRAERNGRAWSYVPPFAVGTTYAVGFVAGRYLISEVIHSPSGDNWSSEETAIGVAETLAEAAERIATAFQRDYC